MRMHVSPRSIRSKLVATSLWIAASIAVVQILLCAYLYRTQKAAILGQQRYVALVCASRTHSLLRQVEDLLESHAEWFRRANPSQESFRKTLVLASLAAGNRINFSMLPADREALRSMGKESHDTIAVLNGARQAVGVASRNQQGEATLGNSVGLFRGRRLVGIVHAEMSPAFFSNALTELLKGNTAVALLTPNGETVFEAWNWPQGRRVDWTKFAFVRGALLGKADSPREFVPLKGMERYIGCAAPVETTGCAVVVFEPLKSAMAAVSINVRLWAGAILLCFLVGLFLFWIQGNKITRPIRRLTRTASALAVGDLRKRVDLRTGDELESLANSFNAMAEHLAQHEKEMVARGETLAALLEVARAVASSLCSKRVAEIACQAVHRQFGASGAVIFRRSVGADDLQPLYCEACTSRRSKERSLPCPRGQRPPDCGSCRRRGRTPPPTWVAFARRVCESGQISTARVKLATGNEPRPEQLLISVPLKGSADVLGALVLAAELKANGVAGSQDEPFGFAQDRLDLLEAFGAHVAAAIENADLHERTEEHSRVLSRWVDELSALRAVTEAISQSLNLNNICRALAGVITGVTSCSACSIYLTENSDEVRLQYPSDPQDLIPLDLARQLAWEAIRQSAAHAVADLRAAYLELDMESGSTTKYHSVLSAPLCSEGQAIGAIQIWFEQPRTFSPEETSLMTAVGAYAGAAADHAKMYDREFRIAETLQHSLQGTIPDKAGELSFGSRYVPVLEEVHVGGDFYDVIPLPGGKVGVVIADVAGKGLQAAMHTAMCKNMLRAFAFEKPLSPALVLQSVNRALAAYGDSRFFVTIFYGVIDAQAGTLIFANAGHPPAILCTNANRRQTRLYKTGIPAACDQHAIYHQRTVRLQPGDLLLLFTDGLTDSPSEEGFLDFEGLEDFIFSIPDSISAQDFADTLCAQVMNRSHGRMRDDLAILAVRFGQARVADLVSAALAAPVEV